ncbi:tetratricopeptide repeat protein [Streptacidiphilus pinicola]|uniref:Tetratricopeptide repeat protein n=1 Tax=Streptacidiphilus pinicola TaxID=2219663 RepID=A0A2X0IFF7_9ACTN|nr:FxSxx-COOH system tetratricopeptide repeat protein [Streptacidiphilus pinicola]RAG83774.1 tetratricopeptide repeat protein [Streptacidiphilus pinicola]
MEGLHRERAPGRLSWREIADAAWLASAVLRSAGDQGTGGQSTGGQSTGGQGQAGQTPDAGSGPDEGSDPVGGEASDDGAEELLAGADAALIRPDPGDAAPGELLLGPGAPESQAPGADESPATAGRTGPPSGEDAASHDQGRRALPFRLARRHGVAPLARALRVLRRDVPDSLRQELDEERTAERGMADDLWLPYTRRRCRRALELLLFVDTAPTMAPWAQVVAQIAEQAVWSGAFRDVRMLRLEVPEHGAAVLRHAGGGVGDPSEALGPAGSQLYLVVTDGLAPGWAGSVMDGLLGMLARKGPTAISHVLPTSLWHRSSLVPHRARFGSAGFAAPNTRLLHDQPPELEDPLNPAAAPGPGRVPVPVLSLKKESFAAWAALVAGEPGLRLVLPGVMAGALALGSPAPGMRAPRTTRPQDAQAAVRRFASLASPPARRLAAQLAASAFQFDVIMSLQQRLSPRTGPSQLAEIFMGGLIDWNREDTPGPDFALGVREALLATTSRSEVAEVVSTLAELPAAGESGAKLRAALIDPEGTPLPEAGQPWITVEKAVMRALSGPYAVRARRLAASVASGHTKPSTANALNAANVLKEGESAGGPSGVGAVPPLETSTAVAENIGSSDQERENPVETRYVRTGQPKVMGNVPPKNPHFTGREELLGAVADRLRGDGTAAVLPHALHGMGGVGKTQIALEYVYRRMHEYNVIWWIPAERESLILGALAELAVRLGLETGPQANTAVPAVREALRTGQPYDNWLLVFDNATDIDTVRRYFPIGGPGQIIVTSRNPEWERVARPLTVDVFQREESIALLQRRAQALSREDANRLAEALGDLPLAIEQAAAWHAATGMTVGEYLELLEQRRPGILQLDPAPDYPLPVAAAWDISLERLSAENPAARDLLQVCACMAPEPIPLSLLRTPRSVEVSPLLDPVLQDPVKLGRATRELSRLSLIRLDHKTGTLQMHRLMQAVLQAGMDEQRTGEMRRAAQVLLAAAKPAGSTSAADQWPAFQALLPHVQASGAAESTDPWVRELVYSVVDYLFYWGAHETAAQLARTALIAWRVESGEEDPLVIQMTKQLAFLLRFLGGFEESFTLTEQALEVSRRASVAEEELLDSMRQMSMALRYRGDVSAGLRIDREAYTRARDLFGPDDPSALIIAHDLGLALKFAGRFGEALELDEETAQQREQVFGPLDARTLNTLNAISVDVRESGDYARARLLQEETYRSYCTAFGVDNAASVRAARELAVCRRRDGDLAGAAGLNEETLQRLRTRYGDTYIDTLSTAMNAMVDRRLRGEPGAAREIGEETVKRFAESLGPGHLFTLSAQVNLAATLRALGEVSGATRLDEEAVEGFRRALGERHLFTLTAELSRANDDYAALEFEAARERDEAALRLLEAEAGEDHPVTLACRANLALDLRGLGRLEEADEHHAQALEGLRRVLGQQHPTTTAAGLHQRIEFDLAALPI